MTKLDELKESMLTAAKILLWELGDMWGDVSARTPDGKKFLLLPLRPSIDPKISDNDVLEYDLDGKLVSGRRDEPEEICFYTCAYKAKKEPGAVIHVHPPVATALVATGRRIIPMRHRSLRFGKEVPITPWLYGISRKDGEQAAKAMGDNCAVMINGHGAIVTGETLQEACLNAIELEQTAKMMVMASRVGMIEPFLSSRTLNKYKSLQDARRERHGRPTRSVAWSAYEAMAKKRQRSSD